MLRREKHSFARFAVPHRGFICSVDSGIAGGFFLPLLMMHFHFCKCVRCSFRLSVIHVCDVYEMRLGRLDANFIVYTTKMQMQYNATALRFDKTKCMHKVRCFQSIAK